jgi:FkbM family methyltransferase
LSVRLTTHHIGGREGYGPFALPEALAGDAPVVLYEADPDAIEGMKSSARPVTAVSKCVGKARGRALFNITEKPHGSSLLRMSRQYAEAYYHKTNEDPVMGVTFRVARTIEVDVDSLDSILASNELGVHPPDVLTLDTEGTEYDILEGADRLLRTEIVGVVAEVAFVPLREGQKLYGDVAALLSRRGFVAVRIVPHGQELSLYRGPVGLRGRGLQAVADAVFLKHPDSAVNDWAGPDAAIKLRKLAIVALTYGLLEYALDCLSRARRIGVPNVAAPPRYWTFLDALEASANAVGTRFLPVPGAMPSSQLDGAPVEAPGLAKCAAPPSLKRLKASLKQYLARHPKSRAVIIRILIMLVRTRMRIAYIVSKRLGSRSSVERLLAENGFIEVSNDVRELRLRQSPWVVAADPGHGR